MLKLKADAIQEIIKRQKLDQLKKVAKFKKGTPEGNAAQKVLTDIEMSNQGGEGGAPPQESIV